MKKILTVNPGSTSTKYKLFNLKGLVLEEHNYTLEQEKEEQVFLASLEAITKIALRVVHGGDTSEPSKITKSLKKKIADYVDFAPIHNTRALETIEKLEAVFAKTAMYACFDTAFHSTMPESFTTYPVPLKLAKKHKLKKYGFHGLAVHSALNLLQKQLRDSGEKLPKKLLFAHLGGGCSITAVEKGKSIATSMGLTPISGIMMTTRIGDVDSDLDKIIAHKENISIDEVSHILSFESGFYGMTGSKDTLRIFNKAKEGSAKEKKAFDVFISEIIEKMSGYVGLMQGVDGIVFTGGVGYGNEYLRKEVLKKMKFFGLGSKDIYPIDVDEELLMFQLVKNL